MKIRRGRKDMVSSSLLFHVTLRLTSEKHMFFFGSLWNASYDQDCESNEVGGFLARLRSMVSAVKQMELIFWC